MGLRDLAQRWRILKKSDAALRGEDMDALRVMDHEALVRLAWEALNTVEHLDDEGYDYLIEAIEEHVDGPGPGHHVVGKTACMWVIAQSDGGDNHGGWNKWCKAVGGRAPSTDGAYGEALLFDGWSDAKDAYDRMYTVPNMTYRIYPVVVVAGNEPRTTEPRRG